MDKEFFALRVEQVKDASTRARWVLAFANLIAVGLLSVTFNLTGSFLRSVALGAHERALEPVPAGSQANPVAKLLTEAALKGWVDSHFVSVPIVGVKFNVADSAIVGGLFLAVLSVWMLFSMRRENHLIGQVLREVKDQVHERSRVYLGVCATQIFATVTDSKEPIDSIERSSQISGGLGVSAAFRFIIYLPAFAIGTMIFADFLTLLMPSPFRDSSAALGLQILKEPSEAVVLLVKLFIEVALFSVTLVNSTLCRRFQDGTMKLLRDTKTWANPVDNPQAMLQQITTQASGTSKYSEPTQDGLPARTN